MQTLVAVAVRRTGGDIGGNIADQTDLMEQIGGRMADGVWVTSGTYYVAPICQGINLTFTPVYNRVYLYPIFAPALIRTFVMGVSFSAVTGTIMIRQAIYGSDAQG